MKELTKNNLISICIILVALLMFGGVVYFIKQDNKETNEINKQTCIVTAKSLTQCKEITAETIKLKRKYVLNVCGKTYLAEYGQWCEDCYHSCRIRGLNND